LYLDGLHSGQGILDLRNTVRFLLGDTAMELTGTDPTRTVLQYLREDVGLCGTKEGCAEGDCGACTVMVAARDARGGIRYRPVNSCIMFMPALDGKQLLTVEHLRAADDALHPVQQAMVDHHASQCGFCTPGFVMSLAALYMSNETPDRTGLAYALAGNLCRCTGYRPILDAAQTALAGARPAPDLALRQRLDALDTDSDRLEMTGAERRFVAPRTLGELTAILAAEPAALVLAGGTDIGLWVTKQHRHLPLLVATEHVAELQRIEISDTHLTIGAAVTYADAMADLAALHPGIASLLRRIGSRQIRERGTVGGNIANASPIGDMPPLLLVLDAVLVLASAAGERRLPLRDFFQAYRKTALAAGEVIAGIEIPRPHIDVRLGVYKISKRFDQDISAICGAFALRLDQDRVDSIRIAYGGMAAIPMRAAAAEQVLTGEVWTEAAVRAAMVEIDAGFSPLSDMRASASYRSLVARNLMLKFYLEHPAPQTAPIRLRLDLPETARADTARALAGRTLGSRLPAPPGPRM
jgi:xanthine dehydrogenase small subunit